MADLKISQLGSIVTVVPATDVLPVVQGGTTYKVTPNQLLGAGGTATLASATITGAATVGTTLGVTGVSTFAAGTALLPALTTTGDTNTGIYYPAADTFAVTTGGTERYRADSSGNVGVGVTPTNVVGQTRVEIKGSGSGNLTLRTASSNLAARDWQVACNLDTFGELNFRQGASQGAEPNSGTTRMVLTAAGNVSVSTGNVVIGTSGKGIDFSATTPDGSGTVTDELLDDYEEGTFVPTLSGSPTNPTTTQSGTGRYTKVGRQVTVQIFFNNVNTAGAVGRIIVNGLPFANNGTAEAISNAAFINMGVFTGSPFGLTTSSSTTIDMYSSQSGGTILPVTYNAGAVQYLWANLTYTI